MTTMGFISRYLKKLRLKVAAALACAVFLSYGPVAAFAANPEAVAPEVAQLQVERNPDGVFLTAAVRFDLPAAVEDALLKGVPMYFVAEADVYRPRWYWYSKKLFTAERHIRLAYQPLTRRWRLNVASGAITGSNMGLALNQSFESLPEALAAVKRISKWKILDATEIEPDQKYGVEFRFKLDLGQLPRPLQIGVLGQVDWNIFATASQQLNPQAAK